MGQSNLSSAVIQAVFYWGKLKIIIKRWTQYLSFQPVEQLLAPTWKPSDDRPHWVWKCHFCIECIILIYVKFRLSKKVRILCFHGPFWKITANKDDLYWPVPPVGTEQKTSWIFSLNISELSNNVCMQTFITLKNTKVEIIIITVFKCNPTNW